MKRALPALTLVAMMAAVDSHAQVTSYAVIPNQGDGTASVIETKTRTVRPDPITVGDTPEGAAWTPDGRVVYITNVFDDSVSFINVAAGDTFGGDIPVGVNPSGIVVSPDGRFAYVANTFGGTISVIDTANQQVDGSPIDVPAGPFGLTISPDGARLYVTSIGSGDLSIVDTVGRNVIATENVGCQPTGVTISPDGATLYMASCATDTVNVYDAFTLVAGPQIPVGLIPENLIITPDGHWIYVSNSGSDDVSVIDTTTNAVVTTIPGFDSPSGIAVTPDGKEIYVTNYNDTTVHVVDVATNTIVDTLAVGNVPVGRNVFISPSIVIADGGPLMLSNDTDLDPLGFKNWVPMNGGTMVLTNHVTSARQLSMLINNGLIDTNGFDATFKGVDFSLGMLVKNGAGTLTLTGDGTGLGTVVGTAGRLIVNGVNSDGSVTLNGAALGGVGQMALLTVNSGEVAPGVNGPGIFRAGNATFLPGTTLRIELNGLVAGTGYDRLQVDGSANIAGANLVLTAGFVPAAGAQLIILTNATGTFSGLPQGTAISDVTVLENHSTGPIDFTVSDDFAAANTLIATVSSSNTAVVPNDQATLTGTGSTRTLTIVPALDASGTSTITVTVSDGVLSSQRSFLLTVSAVPRYLLSEGATGTFFDTDVIIANPHGTSTPVRITFTTQAGALITQNRTLLPMSQTRIKLDDVEGLVAASVSTMVTSTEGVPLVVERTMRWDSTGYGASAEKAAPGAATEWYFAEGSQGFFSTFVLLANPNATANTAHITWLREGAAPVTRDYAMNPLSRVTVNAGDDAELINSSFGAHVVFDLPGVAERAMYFGTSPLWRGGHEAAGVTTPSTTWFLAEGATGTYFTTFVLLANPNDQPAEVTLRYLPADGVPVTKKYTLEAQQRLTRNIAFEDATLANAAVATEITATLPIVAERAQYWPGNNWEEAHASAGVTQTDTRWGLADGLVGGPQNNQTYILLANPGTNEAKVVLTFLRPTGETITRFFTVPAATRRNVSIAGLTSDVPELINASFGAIIESDQPIVVERSMYSDAGGIQWAAGTNLTATPLPQH